MLRRPLVLVIALTVGDYLLWIWSLNSGHDVFSLIAGVTLPPLLLACVWMFVVATMRLLVGGTRARAERSSLRRAAAQADASRRGATPAQPAQAASTSQASSKLAA